MMNKFISKGLRTIIIIIINDVNIQMFSACRISLFGTSIFVSFGRSNGSSLMKS